MQNIMVSTDCLIVFTRAPELGHCKRRLAEAIGASAALAAHVHLVEHTLTRLRDFSGTKVLCVTQLNPEVTAWCDRYNFAPTLQVSEDLGVRMFAAFEDVFASGAKRVVLLGTDCPDIDLTYAETAFAQLMTHDLVLGPAEDGGYGLIGLTTAWGELFESIEWGSSAVTAQTLEKAQALELNVALLDEIWDVDNAADWQRYLKTQR